MIMKIQITKFLIYFPALVPGNIFDLVDNQKIPSNTSSKITGKTKQKIRAKFCNFFALISLLGFILAFRHIYQQFYRIWKTLNTTPQILATEDVQALTTDHVQVEVQIQANGSHVEDDSAAIYTTALSHELYHTMNGILNASVRIIIWIYFPKITEISLKLKDMSSNINKRGIQFSKNEVAALILILLDSVMQQWEILTRKMLFGRHSIFIHLDAIFSESCPLECLEIVLLFFVKLVTENLGDIINIFEESDAESIGEAKIMSYWEG